MTRLTRAYTLVELLITLLLTVVVASTTTLLYSFFLIRTGNVMAAFTVHQQATYVMSEMERVASNALTCDVMTGPGMSGLQCRMPNGEIDRDGDGYPDSFSATTLSKRLKEVYQPGRVISIYQANSTGAFGTAGTIWWRAIRTDNAAPTAADADRRWALINNAAPRASLVQLSSITVDNTLKLVNVTLRSTSQTRAERASSINDRGADSQDFSLNRIMYMGSQN